MPTSGTQTRERTSKLRIEQSQRGFTLVEIVVVTAIIALMLMLAAGSFDFLVPEYALRADARALAGHMKLAKGEALASGRDVYIAYDLPNGEYWMWVLESTADEEEMDAEKFASIISGESEFEWTEMFHRKLEAGIQFNNIIYGRNKRISTGTANVRVTPMGTADHHIVNIRGSDGMEMAVKINGITGVVSFYDKAIEE